MITQIVRFRSELSEEELIETAEARAPEYRALKGLAQKYYLRYPATGEYGAVYFWESEDALEKFRQSELIRSIPDAYQIQGAPGFESANVLMLLRSDD